MTHGEGGAVVMALPANHPKAQEGEVDLQA